MVTYPSELSCPLILGLRMVNLKKCKFPFTELTRGEEANRIISLFKVQYVHKSLQDWVSSIIELNLNVLILHSVLEINLDKENPTL